MARMILIVASVAMCVLAVPFQRSGNYGIVFGIGGLTGVLLTYFLLWNNLK